MKKGKAFLSTVVLFICVVCFSPLSVCAEEDTYDNLQIHKQVLQDTNSICGVIFLGYVQGEAGSLTDDPAYLENVLDLSGYTEDFSFLNTIPADHVVEVAGGNELYCIFPLDENASVSVNEFVVNASNHYYGD